MKATYIRLSQNRSGDLEKPEAQRAMCKVHLNGAESIEFLDDDRSAFRGKRRPAYERMLEAVRAGQIDTIVCRHLDRLLRDMTQMEQLIDLVEQTGVRIELINSPVDLNSPAGRTNARVLAAFAAGEVETKSQRHKDKAASMRAKGLTTGGPRPFGWEEPNGALRPEEADLIREGIRHIIDGGSLRSIYTAWNEAGVRTSLGRTWDPKATARALCRYRNAGVMEHGDQPVEGVEVAWEAICTREEIDAVRAILRDPSRATTSGPKAKWLLTNIITCGKCGHAMTVKKASSQRVWKGKRYSYDRRVYRCTGPSCYVSVPVEQADEAARTEVRRILALTDPASLAPTQEDRDTLTSLRRERGELEESRAEIGERVGSRAWTVRMADAALVGINARLEEIEAQLASMAQSFAVAAMVAEPARVGNRVDIERAAEVGKRFDSLDLDRRRAIVRELIEISVAPGRAQDRVKASPKGQAAA